MSTGTKQLIWRRIGQCRRQRTLDRFMALVSQIFTGLIIGLAYFDQRAVLVPMLFIVVTVHVAVIFYCERLWTIRIREWEKVARMLEIAGGIRRIISRDDLRASGEEWGESEVKSPQLLPI
jgi:hypothetical protein